ncbi:TRAP transporter large permease [Pararhodobacter oceanensis]|uniref:TRAP transporter large permease n=1 Tax=Pararhodobacter oceanensis TaxID=2172121 RepID=UPI003A951F80
MSPFEIGLISVVAMVVMIYLGVYIPIALGMVSFVTIWILRDSFQLPLALLKIAVGDSVTQYSFATIPLFTFMGLIVSKAGMGEDVYRVMNTVFYKITGGVGMATVGANALFAAVTGSSIASASVFTKVAVPEMMKLNYNKRFAVGVVAGSSVLGMIIPPSAMLIIYAIVAEQSVGHMFLAGIIPGIMLSGAYILAIWVMARLWPRFVVNEGAVNKAPEDLLSAAQLLMLSLPLVGLVITVLGGIYTGWLTPVEAGAAGAALGLLLAIARGKINLKSFWNALLETGHITAAILFLITAASMYSRMLGIAGVPNALGDFLETYQLGFAAVMVMLVLLMLFLGTLLDTASIILIVVPLFLPIVEPLGVNLVWFGIIVVIGAEIGLLTPPLGISCFVIKSSISDPSISLKDVFMGALPFAAVMLCVLLVLIEFPILSTVLLP